jgi:hypothetical protein
MKKFAAAVILAGIGFATPAMADEARVEARGGIAFSSGDSVAVAGLAAGYDFDLGESGPFIGGEVSADLPLDSDANVLIFGFTGRIGAKVGDEGRLFAAGGYSVNGIDAFHVGAGYQHKFGDRFYGKLEYRRFLSNNYEGVNSVVAGIGLAF